MTGVSGGTLGYPWASGRPSAGRYEAGLDAERLAHRQRSESRPCRAPSARRCRDGVHATSCPSGRPATGSPARMPPVSIVVGGPSAPRRDCGICAGSNSHSRVASCGSDCGSGPRCAWRGSSSGNVPASSRVGKLCGLRCLAAAIVGRANNPTMRRQASRSSRASSIRRCVARGQLHHLIHALRRCRWPCSTSSTAINCSLAMPTAARRPSLWARPQRMVSSGSQQLEPIIVEVDAQGVAAQPRRQRVTLRG